MAQVVDGRAGGGGGGRWRRRGRGSAGRKLAGGWGGSVVGAWLPSSQGKETRPVIHGTNLISFYGGCFCSRLCVWLLLVCVFVATFRVCVCLCY